MNETSLILEILDRFGLPIFLLLLSGWFLVRYLWPFVTEFILERQLNADMALKAAQDALSTTLREMSDTMRGYADDQKKAMETRISHEMHMTAVLETILAKIDDGHDKIDLILKKLEDKKDGTNL